MFIVVAIVIFGIFVSLSYTLFGKTLQPSLVGLFEQAAYEQVYKVTDETYFDFDKETGTIKGFSEKGHLEKPSGIVIPEYIGNEKVVAVGEYAFDSLGDYNDSSLDFQMTSIVLPPTIKRLEKESFSNHPLTTLILPEGLEYISAFAFDRGSLTNLVIPNSVTEIGYAAFNGSKIENLVLGKSVEKIGSYAFGQSKLSKLFIPKSVIEIGIGSFNSHVKTEVTLPDTYENWVKTRNIDITAFHKNSTFKVNK